MSQDAFRLQIRLMRREAAGRMGDSALLASSIATKSDSAYLLELLAFEILLKALVRIHGCEPGNSHRYRDIFKHIPADVRKRVVDAAAWVRRTANYGELDEVLEVLGRNFINLRYPYEKYADLGTDDYLERSEGWWASGAHPETADFVYHSAELNGLTVALAEEVDSWLSTLAEPDTPA